ncbi:MAG: bifunctional phosphoribosylaminoimidazolecarboxamide formyltransferase/IMP cyclohydrolase [Bacteroidota bacterium]
MEATPIKTALVSVFSKEGLEPIVTKLHKEGVTIYSTGGTQAFIEKLGIPVISVESLTSYPSILDGRVKTLHPKVFGGILARREQDHLSQLENYEIPSLDLVIVDLYPFEDTLASTDDEKQIIEKIDIGGISLIRAAAKNYDSVAVVSDRSQYAYLLETLQENGAKTSRAQRKKLAAHAFRVSSHYDTAIFSYFDDDLDTPWTFNQSILNAEVLRYGENPHQKGVFHGNLSDQFEKLNGKALSYNNLVDVDAAVGLMREFKDDQPTFAVLKHTNPCGVAQRDTVLQSWKDALAGDSISAFGGILIANTTIDKATAEAIDKIFYEVLIAPEFDADALTVLKAKKNRILLKIKSFDVQNRMFKTLLNGVIEQEADLKTDQLEDLTYVTTTQPTESQIKDLLFASKCAKHLKSNTIVLAKDNQLVGMGCGQTSRVDALKQAIIKAGAFGFDLKGAVMASDAFFPFPDCVEIADQAGIVSVIQPGGSKRDQDSIDYCNEHQMSMVMTGTRHFKH